MSEQKVSPLPWKVIETPVDGGYAHPEAKSTRTIEAADLYDVAVTIGDCVPQESTNAAFIVLAVNNHAQLVEALERAELRLRYLAEEVFGAPNFTDRYDDGPVCLRVADKARAALAAAKEPKP